MVPNLPVGFPLKTHPVWPRGGRFSALREFTACCGDGAEIRSPKVAIRPNGWLYKIIIPAISLILISSFNLGTILIQFHPPANVTPDFQKRIKKRNTFSKRVIFSTDCSQSMGLQSVLKIRAKTLKLFALHALPCK